MARINVLHIIAKLELGGAQLNTLYTLKNLDRQHFNPLLVTGRKGMLVEEAKKMKGVEVIFVSELRREINPILDLITLFKLFHICRKKRIDIVHTHGSKAGILGRWAGRLAKVPIIIHTVHGWGFNDYQHRLVRNLFILLEKLSAKITTKLVVVAKANMEKGLAQRIGNPSQYTAIRSGIEMGNFGCADVDIDSKRKELGLRPDVPVVAMVSCFKPQKAPLDFIEAAARVSVEVPEVQFLLVGDGILRRRIEKRIKRMGLEDRVILTGWRRDVPEIMGTIDIFVLTSLWEGLPRVILEAMASAKPVVATDVGGNGEVVVNGETGFLVPPGEPSLMAGCILSLLREPARAARMGKEGRQRLSEEFDIKVMVEKLTELYPADQEKIRVKRCAEAKTLKNLEWKSELRFIQSVLKRIIYGEDSDGIASLLRNESLDWKNLETLLNYHELTPFMYLALKPYRDLLPDRIDQFLHNHYWSSVTNNLLYEREHRVVHDAFQKEEVGLVPIKGTGLMWDLYTRYSIRPMTDIDVLIREEDYSKAAGVLQQIGYKKTLEGLTEDYWLNRQCHVVFLKQREVSYPLRLELHLRLDFKRNNKDILPLVWERTRGFEVDGKRIQLLSPEDTLFSLALHQRRFGKMFCLKYVLDTALLMRKYREEFDWDYVFSECKKNALFSCVYFLLMEVKLFLGNDILDTAGSPLFPLHKKRKERIARFISREINTLNLSEKVKENYLKAHFLLYDSYWEPVQYIINIPQEQFAKFYGLQSYALRTRFFYRFRFAYMIFRLAGEFSTQHKRLKD